MTTLQPILSSLSNRSDGFLYGLKVHDTGWPGTRAILGRFDQSRYAGDLFDKLDIAFPSTLANAVDKRRAEFLAGRAVAAAALSALGLPVRDIPVGTDRAPIWPPGTAGSISHARGLCAGLAIADPAVRVGIDVERPAGGSALASILQIALSDKERVLIEAQRILPQDQLATLVFSAKETVYKTLYQTVRTFFGFECAELVEPPLPDRLMLRLTKTLHPKLPAGSVFAIRYTLDKDQILTWLILPAPEL